MTSKEKVDHTFRRKWDKAALDAQAAALEAAGTALADVGQAADTRRYTVREADITGRIEARRTALVLDAKVGQREAVADARTAGFYCDVCDRAEKDSAAWLDHLNSALHQRRSGRLALAEQSTLGDVRAHLATLKRKALLGDDESEADADAAKRARPDDELAAFEARLEQLRQSDEAQKAARKAARKARKLEAKRAARREARRRNGLADDDDDDGEWEDVGVLVRDAAVKHERAKAEVDDDDDDEWEDAGVVVNSAAIKQESGDVKQESAHDRIEQAGDAVREAVALKREIKAEKTEADDEALAADGAPSQEELDMAALMGFSGFSTTKNPAKR